jgi:inactivated superfamily I helicase
MGVLESRVLDFDTVIVTSMNEGKFPAGKSQNSFIPYDVKRVRFAHSKRKTPFTPIIFIIYCNVLKTSAL